MTVIDASRIAAVIPTRGDVELQSVLDSLPPRWERIVWDNSGYAVRHTPALTNSVEGLGARFTTEHFPVTDLGGPRGAAARYAAIDLTSRPVIYTQDDDCIVPRDDLERLVAAYRSGTVTALMPPGRNDYTDTVLLGWGSLFDRDLPARAFARWEAAGHLASGDDFNIVGADFVFPLLVPHQRIDGDHDDLPHAHAANRTWGSFPNYAQVKADYLARARRVRDGAL